VREYLIFSELLQPRPLFIAKNVYIMVDTVIRFQRRVSTERKQRYRSCGSRSLPTCRSAYRVGVEPGN
jgi:hypothetical protein